MAATALRLGVIALATLLASQAFAKSPRAAKFKINSVDIKYVEPTSTEHLPVLKLLQESRGLERVQALLKPIRLPRRLLLQTKGCDGTSNAWYDGESVTVCYEYLDDLWKAAPDRSTGYGVAPIDALIGPMADVFLHEAGHAVYDILQIPRLGREEDAADQFSTFILLRFPKQDARRMVLGSAYQYKGDLAAPSVSMKQQQFADEHGTPAQRYYNLLCMAYGADKELFADLVSSGLLPKDRAEGCEDEYQQVAFAMDKLLGPYVDRRLATKLQRAWLPPRTTKLKRWRTQ